jgi:hypothetical protein
MADYRIICTNQEPADRSTHDAHIVAVGTGTSPDSYTRKWTVAEVYAAMDRGDTFHTIGRTSGRRAEVRKWSCRGCRRSTLRSASDAVTDNNLDELPQCE